MDIQIRVMPALRLRGSLKAVMPFEMASTPVSAVVPFANACRSKKGRNRPQLSQQYGASGGSTTVPSVPVSNFEQTYPDSYKHHDDKEIRWQCKERSRFFHTAAN